MYVYVCSISSLNLLIPFPLFRNTFSTFFELALVEIFLNINKNNISYFPLFLNFYVELLPIICKNYRDKCENGVIPLAMCINLS